MKVKLFFASIIAWFTTFRSKVHTAAVRSVHIVEQIKKVIDNPALDFVTSLTPFAGDEVVLNLIRKALTDVAALLRVEATGTDQEVIAAIGDILKDRSEDFKKLFYRELALAIGKALEDGKVTTSELLILIEVIYRKIKDEKNG